jgi:hypothetical protein
MDVKGTINNLKTTLVGFNIPLSIKDRTRQITAGNVPQWTICLSWAKPWIQSPPHEIKLKRSTNKSKP